MELPVSLIESSVDRGSILHGPFHGIDHQKFFVVIGVTEECVAGFFYINSAINRNINKKPGQLRMQYPIHREDYTFLARDSYICATEIQRIPRNRLSNGIAAGDVLIKGTLKEEHLNDLLNLTRNSNLFTANEKKLFLY